MVVQLPPQVERLLVFSEHPDLTSALFFSPAEKVFLMDSWDDVLRALEQRHGSQARVGVYTSAEVQYCGAG